MRSRLRWPLLGLLASWSWRWSWCSLARAARARAPRARWPSARAERKAVAAVAAVAAASPGRDVAWLSLFFAAGAGMNLYMKQVLSRSHVDSALKGIPIGFLLTSIQQLVAFLVFLICLLPGHLAGYRVQRLTSWHEILCVLLFSVAFALNIGLNNFSLCWLDLSVNQVIRSSLPLATALVEMFARPEGRLRPEQWLCLILGVLSAAGASYCKMPKAEATFMAGVLASIGSIFFGALNMVLAGFLGTNLRLNPVDSTCYMAIPAGLTMLFPALWVRHDVKWPGFGRMTDWQILQEVARRNQRALAPVFFSGVLAFGYNALQYFLVGQHSATSTSLAGNFNMAGLIFLSLVFGFESLPRKNGMLFVVLICTNIISFVGFNIFSRQ